ncbi:hypothetical protein ACFFK0_13295 [Paenibacillus chartarius]|uniref:Interferon-induced transmembrane protein n=1 Tax=Paenibacillus chartarius TaxID=747481 RepID=A0ABV6DL88_9BACL
METPVNGQPNYNPYAAQQQTAPVISFKEWMITLLLLAIPVVNLIMLFVWAFGGGANPSKANYAKAGLVWMLIGIVLYIVFLVLAVVIGGSIASGLGDM